MLLENTFLDFWKEEFYGNNQIPSLLYFKFREKTNALVADNKIECSLFDNGNFKKHRAHER